MEKIANMRRKIIRNIFKGLTLTSSAFVFQACYGTGEDFGADALLSGVVKSKITNMPIPGIKVSIDNQPQYEVTDADGQFEIYVSTDEDLRVCFEDIDAGEDGAYLPKDTVVQATKNQDIILDIKLDAVE
jgi:hypothetical protein